MGALRYFWDWVRMAFSHSIELAQTLLFLAFVASGAMAYFFQGAAPKLDGPEIAAIVVGAIVLIRLIMAPYWLHREQEKRVPKYRPEYERSNTKLDLACRHIATASKWCLRFDSWPVFEKAYPVLKEAIYSGEIEAWGRKQATDPVFVKIPVEYWKDHAIFVERNDTHYADHRDSAQRSDQTKLYDLHVDRDAIVQHWPKATEWQINRHQAKVVKLYESQRL